MAEEIGMRAEISADARQYIRAIDDAIDANQRFGKSVGLTSTEIDKQDKRLNQVRGAVSTTSTETGKATKTQEGFNKSLMASEGNLARTRYALYDVSTTYAAVAAATLGAAAATGTFAAKYESAFTEIERTTISLSGEVSDGLAGLREDFLDLSEVIPLSFEELTKIGSLGAQLGILEKDLVGFTDTVAKFSRLSGVSAEQTALAFGRIGELLDVPAAAYGNLGSAIAATAVSSAATEAQIISLTKEISAGASGAGLAADQVVGLSSTLASLGVAPERARGALSTYFGTLNKAVAEGGENLENFAVITGTTAEQLEELVRTGQGGEVLQRFITGLSELDNVAKTTALDELGLSQLRVEDTFRRLSQNLPFFASQLEISSQAIREGTFLNDAFAIVLDDVASQFQLLLNSIGRFLATAGAPFLEFLRVGLPLLAGMFEGLSEFASTDAGEVFFRVAGSLAVFIGVVAAYRGAVALATASTYALVQAQLGLAASGARTGIGGLIGALFGYAGAASAAAGATGKLRGGLVALGRATVVFALFQAAIELIFNFGEAVGMAIDALIHFNNFLRDVGNNFQQFVGLTKLVGDSLINMAEANDATLSSWQGWAHGLQESKDSLTDVDDELSAFNWDDYVSGLDDAYGSGEDFTDGLGDMGNAAADAAEQVRTLVDYASDLAGVFDRSFSLRFGNSEAGDAVTLAWMAQADAADDAARATRDARLALAETRAELASLASDKRIKEYFLTVAEAYGDELRASELRSEIGEIDADLAKKKAEASDEAKALKEAVGAESKSLTGNSKQAIINRNALRGLIGTYEDQLVALAESGASQEEVAATARRLKAEFMQQATQLGFSRAEVSNLALAFDDMGRIIAGVPRNITVSANTNPALQALAEFAAKARAQGSAAGKAFGSGFGSGGIGRPKVPYAPWSDWGKSAGQSFKSGFRVGFNGALLYSDGTGRFRGSPGDIKFVASGGHITGPGTSTSDSIPAMLSDGEYVMKASSVQSLGTGVMSYINRYGKLPGFASGGLTQFTATGSLRNGSRPMVGATSSSVSARNGGTMMVELSPIDRKLLAAAGNVQLRLDGQVVANATNRVNTLNAQRGTN